MTEIPKRGDRVKFRDNSATTSLKDAGEKVYVREGMVNGDPILDDDLNVVAIPVWAEREGREPTTIFVVSANLLVDA